MSKYYIALDLGSESMAASYYTSGNKTPELIDLQQFAKKYVEAKDRCEPDTSGKSREFDYFKNLDGSVSKRMETKILLRLKSIKNDKNHAELEFVDGDEVTDQFNNSIFSFFPTSVEHWGLPRLPNAKLLFQYDVNVALVNEEQKLAGRDLIQHLCTQIIRNFILKSQELRNEQNKLVEKGKIHLVLTVPNVYSLSHLKSLQKFLENHCGLPAQNISTIYESDAICYYYLSNEAYISQILAEREQRAKILNLNDKEDEFRMLTIDVGAGTTDMSLMAIRYDGKQESHLVCGRVGRSDGGQKLSYILAEYFDNQLELVLDKFKDREGFANTISEKPLSLTQSAAKNERRPSGTQIPIIDPLLELIFIIKSNLNEYYELENLEFAEQYVLISQIVENIQNHFFEKQEPWRGNVQKYGKFINALVLALAFPQNIDGTGISRHFERVTAQFIDKEGEKVIKEINKSHKNIEELAFSASSKEESDLSEEGSHPDSQTYNTVDRGVIHASLTFNADPEFITCYAKNVENLKEKMEEYVEQNITVLLKDLQRMAMNRETHPNPSVVKKRIVNPDLTYIIVAGQGAQFNPIRRSIAECDFARKVGKSNIFELQQDELKNACSIGAVNYLRLEKPRRENRHELHGTYFIRSLNGRTTKKLNLIPNLKTKLTFEEKGERLLRFSPTADFEELKNYSLYDHSRIAHIRSFDSEDLPGKEFKIYYNAQDQSVTIISAEEIDKKVFIDELASYGDMHEDIWPKIWPILLRARDEN